MCLCVCLQAREKHKFAQRERGEKEDACEQSDNFELSILFFISLLLLFLNILVPLLRLSLLKMMWAVN